MNRACFPKENPPEFTKMGEIHELVVLALSLVWFAGATPDFLSLLGLSRFFWDFPNICPGIFRTCPFQEIIAHIGEVTGNTAPVSGVIFLVWNRALVPAAPP